jgi:hypothetical protein
MGNQKFTLVVVCECLSRLPRQDGGARDQRAFLRSTARGATIWLRENNCASACSENAALSRTRFSPAFPEANSCLRVAMASWAVIILSTSLFLSCSNNAARYRSFQSILPFSCDEAAWLIGPQTGLAGAANPNSCTSIITNFQNPSTIR